MKRSCYTDSQIMAILKQTEAGTPIPAVCATIVVRATSVRKFRRSTTRCYVLAL